MLHEVNVASMAIDPTSNTPILILKSVKGDQAVPIWIGLLEATSIASALRNIKFDRPMTHDLFKNFVENLDMAYKGIQLLRESQKGKAQFFVLDMIVQPTHDRQSHSDLTMAIDAIQVEKKYQRLSLESANSGYW